MRVRVGARIRIRVRVRVRVRIRAESAGVNTRSLVGCGFEKSSLFIVHLLLVQFKKKEESFALFCYTPCLLVLSCLVWSGLA